MIEPEKLTAPEFTKFCELVKNNLGEASTEVLYAWYYNTFDTNQKTKKDEGKNK